MFGRTAMLTGLLATLVVTAAAAETYTIYDCNFVIRGYDGDKVRLVVAIDQAGKAFTFEKDEGSDTPKRVPVRMGRDGPEHYVATYSFNISHVDTGTARLDARARFPKAGGASRISVEGRGYSGRATGTGTCDLQQNVRF